MPFSKSVGETHFHIKISTVHPSSGIWECLQPQNITVEQQLLVPCLNAPSRSMRDAPSPRIHEVILALTRRLSRS